MIRNLTALGLATVAVVAISATIVSAASAQQGRLTTDSASATLDITQTGSIGANALTAFGYSVECPGTTYRGHEAGSSTKPVPSNATTATITPEYSIACKTKISGSEYPTTVTTNGCDYLLHTGTTLSPSTFPFTTDIVCPKENDIQVDVFTSSSHTLKICMLTIKPQNGLGVGITAPHITTNPVFDDLTATGTVSPIHIEKSGLCGPETTSLGTLDIDVTVKGTNALGENTGITVTN
jgi:hypothetical protein